MLAVSRSETREIAALAGLEYRDDPMNDDNNLLRTRVRNGVIPVLANLNPQIVDSLANTAATVDRDVDFFESLVPDIPEAGVPVSILQILPRPVSDRLLIVLLAANGIGPSSDLVARMWIVADGDAPSNDLVGGLRVVRRGALLCVE